MSWNASPSAAAWGRLLPWGVHHFEHHVADGGGRATEVRREFVVGVVAPFLDVHQHRVDERVDLRARNVVALAEIGEGLENRVVRFTLAERRRPEPFEFAASLGRGRGVRVVDHVVRSPKEGIQDVRRIADALGKQPGRDVKRPTRVSLDGFAPSELIV